ncbi:putative 3'(2'),5'-bisphosphate nucleotidase [Rosa chinensis]|uniref:Putative 3'(2'),5'-bisphosphate nucleotidase n=2 Tax=Rosa chinensis TaxID=74649 RepID=A0A2P6SGP5_ROSCH|nr:putative 3'(2'),5'-bisphosphate nucleotidase [Rosa chinensis]
MLEQHFNSGISIDMKQSFYIGDAAGRSNDHSDAVLSLQSSVVRVLDYLITCQNLIEKCFKPMV